MRLVATMRRRAKTTAGTWDRFFVGSGSAELSAIDYGTFGISEPSFSTVRLQTIRRVVNFETADVAYRLHHESADPTSE
jgi:hypothetical protein